MTGAAASAPPHGPKLWLAGARPRTLPAAIVPVLVGTAAAAGEVHASVPLAVDASGTTAAQIRGLLDGLTNLPLIELGGGATKGIIFWRFAAAMVVALAIQVGTNYANDYSDGVRGTDSGERVGPLRLVGAGLAEPSAVKKAAVASFGVAALAGLALAWAAGWWLILVGLACFAAGWFYTGGPKPYGYAGYGEVFVFVFFGLVATVGSTYVQIERFTWLSFAAGVAVGFLATALLVINNLRDIPSDTASGKRTLAVKLGDHRTRVLYIALMAMPYVVLPLVAGLSGRIFAAAAFFGIVLAQAPVLKVLQGATGPALVPVLSGTARVQLVFGIVLAAGLFLSAPSLL